MKEIPEFLVGNADHGYEAEPVTERDAKEAKVSESGIPGDLYRVFLGYVTGRKVWLCDENGKARSFLTRRDAQRVVDKIKKKFSVL